MNQSIGSEATYRNFKCNKGFELSGDLSRICSVNGWNGQPPKCGKLRHTLSARSVWQYNTDEIRGEYQMSHIVLTDFITYNLNKSIWKVPNSITYMYRYEDYHCSKHLSGGHLCGSTDCHCHFFDHDSIPKEKGFRTTL